jgi:hypothetical protein
LRSLMGRTVLPGTCDAELRARLGLAAALTKGEHLWGCADVGQVVPARFASTRFPAKVRDRALVAQHVRGIACRARQAPLCRFAHADVSRSATRKFSKHQAAERARANCTLELLPHDRPGSLSQRLRGRSRS